MSVGGNVCDASCHNDIVFLPLIRHYCLKTSPDLPKEFTASRKTGLVKSRPSHLNSENMKRILGFYSLMPVRTMYACPCQL